MRQRKEARRMRSTAGIVSGAGGGIMGPGLVGGKGLTSANLVGAGGSMGLGGGTGHGAM